MAEAAEVLAEIDDAQAQAIVAAAIDRYLAARHARVLHRLIDALGHELRGDSATAFGVRDHYVARIFDLIDRASYRPV